MKKLLTILACAAIFAACNTEEDTGTPKQTNFAGTLTVTSNHENSTTAPYTASNVHYSVTEGDDKTLILTMNDIRFAVGMPKGMTIVIPSLTFEDTHADGVLTLTSTVDPIVPYLGGKPYNAFEILDFQGTYSSGRLQVSFTCKNSRIPVGEETLDHKAVYSGTILR